MEGIRGVKNLIKMNMENLIIDESKINYKVERQVKVRDILIDVPLKYRCSAINAVFPISSKEARNVINCSKLKPYELFPGKSLLCITLFNFFSGPVGPYTEMTLSIPVRYDPKFNLPAIPLLVDKILQKVSFFVFSVAQSTKIAIEHGLAITGYPRYSLSKLINVEFKEDDNFIYTKAIGEGKESKCIKFSDLLFDKGILAPTIRWPAVPWGQARLRLTVKATHTKEQIDFLLENMEKIGKELRVI